MSGASDFGKGTQMDCSKTNATRYECAGASARGFARRENQDRYRLSDTGIVLCDGIGGAEAGEVFAEASCWRCDKLLSTSLGANEIIADANEKAVAIGTVIGSRGGSSACVAKFRQDGSVDISSRGDILAIRLSGQKASIVNRPDYSAECKLEAYLGDGRNADMASQRYCALPLDRVDECFIFVSDGVWKSLSLDEMADTWDASSGDIKVMASSLVKLAGRHGSLDDRTAVVCKRVA